MFIHFARFITPLPKDRVRRLFESRPRRYREVLVLLQKTYIYETSSAPFRGCYIFGEVKPQ